MTAIDVAVVIIRVWVGVVIATHGINHARSLEGTASWFASVGFKSERLQAASSAVVEIGAGALLILGLGTTVGAAGVISTMFVAFWTIHRFNGFFIFRPGEGYEYVSTLAFASLAIAVAGPGSISIDNRIGLAEKLDGWVGAGIAAAAIVGALGHLAVFWNRPEEKEIT